MPRKEIKKNGQVEVEVEYDDKDITSLKIHGKAVSLVDAQRVEIYETGSTPRADIPVGTVLITKNNPTCYWFYTAAGWKQYCV